MGGIEFPKGLVLAVFSEHLGARTELISGHLQSWTFSEYHNVCNRKRSYGFSSQASDVCGIMVIDPTLKSICNLPARLSSNLKYSQTNLKTAATLEYAFSEFLYYFLCHLCYLRPSSRSFQDSLLISNPMAKSLLITCLLTLIQLAD